MRCPTHSERKVEGVPRGRRDRYVLLLRDYKRSERQDQQGDTVAKDAEVRGRLRDGRVCPRGRYMRRRLSAPCWKCSDGSYHASSCMAGSQSCVSDETNLPFMADDGTGGTITIPSFIVSDYDGEVLRQGIRQEKAILDVYITILYRQVNYELWTSSEDHNGAEFKRNFQEVALDLIERTNFRPRYFIYDGDEGCTRPGVTCTNQCILGDKYCAPEPDGQLMKNQVVLTSSKKFEANVHLEGSDR